jgi:uncharacterized protein YhaN
VYYPQDEVILASTVVKTLQEQLTEAMTNLGKANTRWEELNNEVDGMRDDQEGFRESVLVSVGCCCCMGLRIGALADGIVPSAA